MEREREGIKGKSEMVLQRKKISPLLQFPPCISRTVSESVAVSEEVVVSCWSWESFFGKDKEGRDRGHIHTIFLLSRVLPPLLNKDLIVLHFFPGTFNSFRPTTFFLPTTPTRVFLSWNFTHGDFTPPVVARQGQEKRKTDSRAESQFSP